LENAPDRRIAFEFLQLDRGLLNRLHGSAFGIFRGRCAREDGDDRDERKRGSQGRSHSDRNLDRSQRAIPVEDLQRPLILETLSQLGEVGRESAKPLRRSEAESKRN
jgi:hypothetical protein